MKKNISYLLLLLLGFSCSPDSDSADLGIKEVVNMKNVAENRLAAESGPIFNGMFVKNINDGKIYIMFENRLRYIESNLTLYGLFKNPYIHNYSSLTVMLGKHFTSDNGLIVENSTGRVFLREGNVIRYIPNMDIYNLYKFNNGAKTYVSSISNYQLGPEVGTAGSVLPDVD